MLPYFTLISFRLGPLNIYIWGLCVAVGFLAGIFTAYFVCKSLSFSPFMKGGGRGDFEKIFNLSVLLLIFGMLGARIFWWLEHLGEVKSFFDFINISNGGLSSLGGFVFAGIVLAVWSRFFCHSEPTHQSKARCGVSLREESRGSPRFIGGDPRVTSFPRDSSSPSAPQNDRMREASFWQYLDILAISFIPVWIFSRLGCFLIHDHIGRLSNFFLAVKFSGGARHDLALYEIILMIFIGVLFLILKIWSSARERAQIPPAPQKAGLIPPFKKGETEGDFKNRNNKLRDGSYALSMVLIYSFFRFFLDFLRASDLPFSDPRYLSLTLAQWGMAVLFASGVLIFFKRRAKVGL